MWLGYDHLPQIMWSHCLQRVDLQTSSILWNITNPLWRPHSKFSTGKASSNFTNGLKRRKLFFPSGITRTPPFSHQLPISERSLWNTSKSHWVYHLHIPTRSKASAQPHSSFLGVHCQAKSRPISRGNRDCFSPFPGFTDTGVPEAGVREACVRYCSGF